VWMLPDAQFLFGWWEMLRGAVVEHEKGADFIGKRVPA
jgi:hypothetical protein